jgi:YVTN family beta-propeller protein
VAATIGTGISPTAVAVDTRTGMVYVANQTFASNSVSVIDPRTDTVAATVSVGNNPLADAVDSRTNKVYVANGSGENVSVIDGRTNTVVD